MLSIINTALWYIWKSLREWILTFSSQGKGGFLFPYEMMDVNSLWVSQVIMLYTLNLYSAVC